MIPEFPERIEPTRLVEAINHITPAREAQLRETHGEDGGIKQVVSRASGLPGSSTLSDILSGRLPGTRHVAALASALQVDPHWLMGRNDPEFMPDWSLSPYAAFDRFRRRLESALRRLLQYRGRGLNEEDSGTSAVSMLDEERLSRMLGIPQGSKAISDILSNHYEQAALEHLFGLHRVLRLPHHLDVDHLARGQEIANEVAQHINTQQAGSRRRYERYLVSGRLFRMARMALVGIRGQRQYQGKDLAAIDDCLELLWRQQGLAVGRQRTIVPPEFTAETGRTAWTPLGELQRRWPAEGEDDLRRWDSHR